MAEAKIGVQIGADVSNAVTNLKKFDNAVASTSKNFSKLQQGTKVATSSINTLNPASKRAGSALTDLSRIAQDAPFGFIAIQNNLSPLFESFGRLSSSSGGAVGALKALGSSLIGPAGIGVGFAVVSSLITVAIQKYGSLDAAIKDLFGSLSNAEVAQNKLVKSTNDSVASVQGELSVIRGLVSVARDKTLSDGARQEAIDKLNKEYDKYLPKLTLENIETAKVTAAVDKLTKALIRKAKIKGFEDLISEEAKEQAKLFTKDVRESAGIFQKIADIVNVTGTLSIASGLKNVNKELALSKERASIFEKELTKLLKIDALEGTLSDPGKVTPIKSVKPPKEKITIPVFAQIKGIDGIETGFFGDIFKNVKAESTKFLPFSEGVLAQIDLVSKAQERIQSISDTVLVLGQGLNTVFENIANGGNAIQSLGNFITQLIKKLIAAAAQAAILSAIITAATGGTAGAASFGSIFKTLFSNFSGLPKFAEGGVVNKATLGVFGEAGPEAVIPLNQLGRIAQQITGGTPSGGLVANGVLRGTDILLSVTRQQRQNGINY